MFDPVLSSHVYYILFLYLYIYIYLFSQMDGLLEKIYIPTLCLTNPRSGFVAGWVLEVPNQFGRGELLKGTQSTDQHLRCLK